MEDRIVDAIQTLRSATEQPSRAQAPALDLDGLKAIEARLAEQLEALDDRLHATPAPAAAPVMPESMPAGRPAPASDHFAAWQDDDAEEAAAPMAPNYAFDDSNTIESAPTFDDALGLDEPEQTDEHTNSLGLGFSESDFEEAPSSPETSQDEPATAQDYSAASDVFGGPEAAPANAMANESVAEEFAEETELEHAQEPEEVPQPRSAFDMDGFGNDAAPRSLSDLEDEVEAAPEVASTAPSVKSADFEPAADHSAQDVQPGRRRTKHCTRRAKALSLLHAALRSQKTIRKSKPPVCWVALSHASKRVKMIHKMRTWTHHVSMLAKIMYRLLAPPLKMMLQNWKLLLRSAANGL